jgi:hypothetical protein
MENEIMDIIIDDFKEYSFTIATGASEDCKTTYSKLGINLNKQEKDLMLATAIHNLNKKHNAKLDARNCRLILATEWKIQMENEGYKFTDLTNKDEGAE